GRRMRGGVTRTANPRNSGGSLRAAQVLSPSCRMYRRCRRISISDLSGHTLPAPHRALHEPLEVQRRVLTGEVDVALTHGLDAAEARVIADVVLRPGAEQVGVEIAHRCVRLDDWGLGDVGED